MKIISLITLTILMLMISVSFAFDDGSEVSFIIGVPCLLIHSIAGYINAKKENITHMKIMSVIGIILFGFLIFWFYHILEMHPEKNFVFMAHKYFNTQLRSFFNPATFLTFLYAFPYLIVSVIYSFRSNKISGNEFISTPEDIDKVQTNYSKADEISKYKKLLDEGAITQLEFDKEKRNILDNI